MASERILWADDEIDLLKPHILFLQQKGYEVITVNNGAEAIEQARDNYFDIVFLDENMPGINGLTALQRIKESDPTLPVVMITKSEEEHIMEDAIGSKIADYLIKPVNPNQILLSLKKNLNEKRLVSEKTNNDYRQEFREISMRLGDRTVRMSGSFDDKGVTGTAGVVAAVAFVPVVGFFTTGTSAMIPMGGAVKAFLDEDIAFRAQAPAQP
jgi:DNA-binding response OmpR family regulator